MASNRHLYRGKATNIRKRGQVYWLVHLSKVLACSATRLLPIENGGNDEMIDKDDSKTEHKNWISIDKNGDPTETVYELDDGGEFLEQAKVNAIPNAEEGGHDVVPNVEGEDGPSDGESGPYIVPKDKVEGYDPYTEASGDENCEEIQDPNMVRNPENYSKKGDNIQCYNEGVWEVSGKRFPGPDFPL